MSQTRDPILIVNESTGQRYRENGFSVKIFFGRGTLQDMYREWLTSRFATVQTLNPENPTPTP